MSWGARENGEKNPKAISQEKNLIGSSRAKIRIKIPSPRDKKVKIFSHGEKTDFEWGVSVPTVYPTPTYMIINGLVTYMLLLLQFQLHIWVQKLTLPCQLVF